MKVWRILELEGIKDFLFLSFFVSFISNMETEPQRRK